MDFGLHSKRLCAWRKVSWLLIYRVRCEHAKSLLIELMQLLVTSIENGPKWLRGCCYFAIVVASPDIYFALRFLAEKNFWYEATDSASLTVTQCYLLNVGYGFHLDFFLLFKIDAGGQPFRFEASEKWYYLLSNTFCTIWMFLLLSVSILTSFYLWQRRLSRSSSNFGKWRKKQLHGLQSRWHMQFHLSQRTDCRWWSQ